MPSNSRQRQMRVQGLSCNPEYTISEGDSFQKRKDGSRLAPVSQLNTFVGRQLAPTKRVGEENAAGLPDTKEEPQQYVEQDKHAMKPFGDQKHGVSDRERLTSQRPRTELSQLLSMTRSSSLKGQWQAQQSRPTEKAIDTCEQVELPIKGDQSGGFSHICNNYHRFVPSGRVTALKAQDPVQDASIKQEVPPPPPSKYPSNPRCNTCFSIPYHLYDEYRRFFPICVACGYMTDMTHKEIAGNEGDILPPVDCRGERMLQPTKELQDWSLGISLEIHKLKWGDQKAPLPSQMARETSNQPRRTVSTCQQALDDSRRKGRTHSGPTPVSEHEREPMRYTRRFSFDTIEPSEEMTTQMDRSAENMKLTRAQDEGEHRSSVQSMSSIETALEYPAVFETCIQAGYKRLWLQQQELRKPSDSRDGGQKQKSDKRPSIIKRTFTDILSDRK